MRSQQWEEAAGPSRHPCAPHLPSVFRAALPDAAGSAVAEDDHLESSPLLEALLTAFDATLGPVLTSLESLDVYLDPRVTPLDVLDWLAGWVGLVVDETRPAAARRALVADAVALYRWQGTLEGLRAQVVSALGVPAEISDNGGVWSSARSRDTPVAAEPPWVLVRLPLPPGEPDADAFLRRARSVVAAVKPVHVEHRVELLP